MNDKLSKSEILSRLDESSALNVIVLKTVNSTNSYLKELAKNGTSNETLVVADSQTNGRGRLGRDFFSPSGSGIYMSILLKPEFIALRSELLTVAAGVAVCRALNEISEGTPKIKWVNDIFIDNKKVCGILAESLLDERKGLPFGIVIGIGLNVTTPAHMFPKELSHLAGSVFPTNITRNELITKIIDEFKKIYTSSDSNALIDEYKRYSLVLGKKISFKMSGNTFIGVATDINADGNLVVLLENGKELTLNAGEISLHSENFV